MSLSKIRINGVFPTEQQIVDLFEHSTIKSIAFPKKPTDYEENIKFEDATLTFTNGCILVISGYTGLWDMEWYDKFDVIHKQSLQDSLYEWIMFELEYYNEENGIGGN